MTIERPKTVLLSSAYLAPVQYYSKLIAYENIVIEQEEHYIKQTFRNRAQILAANGPLTLSIPVTEGASAKACMKELQLSYDHDWQRLHWRGILSAYNNSPFFEYYADDLAPFYHLKRWKYLIDYNTELQQTILELIKVRCNIRFTESYLPAGSTSSDVDDFRYSIHPKPSKHLFDPAFVPEPYTQVFSEKYDFVANLSILDLLCNEGPSTGDILKSSIR